MTDEISLDQFREYFSKKFEHFGASPQGLDWNSIEAQLIRFSQLQKVIDPSLPYSILDYGCGYGAFFEHLYKKKHTFSYQGFDIVPEMLAKGRELFSTFSDCVFIERDQDLLPADYVVESGIFNVKLSASVETWTHHVIETLERMNTLAIKGMAFNMLTKYSDAEFMREDLYYADPCFFFDYSKNHFSRDVALFHDYQIYDFTIIVRKIR